MIFNVLLVLFGIPMNSLSRPSLNPMLFLHTPTRFTTQCLTKQTTAQPAPTPQTFLLPSLNLHRLSSPRQLKLYFVWRVSDQVLRDHCHQSSLITHCIFGQNKTLVRLATSPLLLILCSNYEKLLE